ncbi:hypothetical protein [Undibacterium sp.]|uniref:hypothetical protein n=1 Tax=Undibacterium sp. TaxID=1914977 RepID=UPI0037520668
MTKNEARIILKGHNQYHRGAGITMQNNKIIGVAIDELCEPPSIAQSIRHAAINWECPKKLEFVLLKVFCNECEDWLTYNEIESRIFMLFVAEALE